MARLNLSFLGTFAASLDEQPLTHFRAANNQGLLVYLALNSAQPVPREVLAALFWPEETEKTARHNLRQALYHLRMLLGDTQAQGASFLTITRHTARFNPQSDYMLDVHEFLAAIEAQDLATAVDVYQGELLPGFTCDSLVFEDWLRGERERLHNLALEALFTATEDHLQAGNLGQAQALARRQLSLEPWREVAFRQLMRAFALSGDRGKALATYEQCREVLMDELGLEPDAQTAALLADIEADRLGGRHADEAVPAPGGVPHNLPGQTTPFIGRKQELAEIPRLLLESNCRLLTLVGPGGIGKTRTAIETARALAAENGDHFPDGVTFVNLAPVDDYQTALRALGDALGYQFAGGEAAQDKQLLTLLREKRLLLLIDNLEHLLGQGMARFLDDLLGTTSGLKMLVTSRERVNLRAETVWMLAGLDGDRPAMGQGGTLGAGQVSDAMQLFEQSALRSVPEFALTTSNSRAVAQICHLCGGMPLGIELAAGWLGVLSPQEIAVELEKSLDILSTTMRDVPQRQRSLRAVFDGSWQRLSAQEREAFLQLSVFRGGFQRPEGETAAGVSLPVLLSLVNKSFLQREAGGRFGLHEQMRYFANERLRQDKEAWKAAKEAHSQAYASFLTRQLPRLRSKQQLAALEAIDGDLDNIRVAWTWLVAQDDLQTIRQQMLPAIFYFGVLSKRFGELHGLLKAALDQLRVKTGGTKSVDNVILQTAAIHLFSEEVTTDNTPQYPGGKMLLQQMWPVAYAHRRELGVWFDLFLLQHIIHIDAEITFQHWADHIAGLRSQGDKWLLAHSLVWYAYALAVTDCGDREDLVQESLALFRQCGDAYYSAQALIMLGWFARSVGDFEHTIACFKQAQQLLTGHREDIRSGKMLYELQNIYLALGEVEQALAYHAEQVALYQRLNRPALLRESLHWQSILISRFGDQALALRLRHESLDLLKQLAGSQEDKPAVNFGWEYFELGEIYRVAGDLEEAKHFYGLAEEIFVSGEEAKGLSLHRRAMGYMALAEKQFELAATIFHQHLAAEGEQRISWERTLAHIGLGRANLGLGHYEACEKHLRLALKETENSSFVDLRLWPISVLAELKALQGEIKQGAQLAAYVLRQPLAWLEMRIHAEGVLAKIQPQLDPDFDRQAAAQEAAESLIPALNLGYWPKG